MRTYVQTLAIFYRLKVAQGSVLAPLLLLIFINDLPLNIPVNVKLFADDCILYNEINSHDDHITLNNALEAVSNWCANWQMTNNAKKSALLTITRKKHRSEFSYSINNVSLTRVYEHKYLGFTITQDLRWDSHISIVTSAALWRLMFLRRRVRLAPAETKLTAYETFIRPVLEYANIVWFPFTVTQIKKLEVIQRKAIRFIYNKYRLSDSLIELIRKAGVLTLQNRAKLARLRFMYQLIHGEIRINKCKYISTTQTRMTRHTHSEMLNECSFHTDSFR